MRKTLRAIIILSIIGTLVSSYLIYQHYKPAGGSFCNVNDYVNCDIVNKSIYAEVAGIPVSIFGLAVYIIMGLTALGIERKKIEARNGKRILNVLTSGSLIFSLYLTYIEFFVLHAVCAFCLTSQTIIIILFILSFSKSLWQKNP